MQLIESVCPQCGMVHKAEKKVDFFGCCQSRIEIKLSDQKKTIRIDSNSSANVPRLDRNVDITNEPGSVLYRILKDVFSIKPKQGCGCNKLRNEMDALGIEGCEREFSRLAAALKENAKAYNWLESFGAALNAIRSGALEWLDPFRPWESILRHAIESSKKLKVVPDATEVDDPKA